MSHMVVDGEIDVAPPRRSRRSVGEVMAVIRRVLPLGDDLDQEEFDKRHSVVLVAAAVTLTIVTAVGSIRGGSIGHVLLEISPMLVAIGLAHWSRSRSTSMFAAVFALMVCSSVMVHFTDGLIESHFLFFVLLPLVALYQDWRAFISSIVFVVLHHAVVGTLAPEAVYNHAAAIANPATWGLIHAAYVVGLVVVLLVEWNFAEAAQRLAHQRLGDLQATQAELLQSQKLESVGQLAAGIAHEINTPMQYIGDNTHFLKATVTRLLDVADAAEAAIADGADDADRAALAAAIEAARLPLLRERAPRAADHALAGVVNVASIVAAMKRFSHPDSQTMEPVDINDSISTSATVCRNEWKYVAELDLRLGEHLPPVDGRLGPLNQVWLNMIVNASHAVADRHQGELGKITVTTRPTADGSAVEVEIVDNGAGIDPEHVGRIFDHFFTTKEIGRGTGQGLAIAYRVIVGDHGGELDVRSSLGEGTTFTVTLPCSHEVTQ